jgi:membrane protein DedA with SNARE-associated domain
MIDQLFQAWMRLIHDWGYAGTFVITVIGFTVFPVPIEVVVPSAAYWATQGATDIRLVVLVAALGTWAGASIAFLVSRTVGRALILRFGRYVFIPEKKWLLAEAWILHYSAAGVFFAQLLPIVRHVVSLPAGAARMRYRTFSLAFLAGALIECSLLAWFGAKVLGARRDLMSDPRGLRHAIEAKLWWLIAAAIVMVLLYAVMDTLGRRAKAATRDAAS